MIQNSAKWIAIQVETTAFEPIKHFFTAILGGKEVMKAPAWSVNNLNDNSILELYAPGWNYPNWRFQK